MENCWGLISDVRSNPKRSVGCQRALIIPHQTEAVNLLPTLLYIALSRDVTEVSLTSTSFPFCIKLFVICKCKGKIDNRKCISIHSTLSLRVLVRLHEIVLVIGCCSLFVSAARSGRLCRASSQPHIYSIWGVSVPLLLGPSSESQLRIRPRANDPTVRGNWPCVCACGEFPVNQIRGRAAQRPEQRHQLHMHTCGCGCVCVFTVTSITHQMVFNEAKDNTQENSNDLTELSHKIYD